MQINVDVKRTVDKKEVARLRGQLKTINNKLDKMNGRKLSVSYNSFIEAKEFTSAYNDRQRLTGKIEEAIENENSIDLIINTSDQVRPTVIRRNAFKFKLTRKWCNDSVFLPEDKKQDGIIKAYQLSKEQILVEFIYKDGKKTEIIRILLLEVGKTFKPTLLNTIHNKLKDGEVYNFDLP